MITRKMTRLAALAGVGTGDKPGWLRRYAHGGRIPKKRSEDVMSGALQRWSAVVVGLVTVAVSVTGCGIGGSAPTPTPTTYACELYAPFGTGVTLWVYLPATGQSLGGAGDLVTDRDQLGWNLDPAELSCELTDPTDPDSDLVITGRDGLTALVDYPNERARVSTTVTFSLSGDPVCDVKFMGGPVETEFSQLEEYYNFTAWAVGIVYKPGQEAWSQVESTCAEADGVNAAIKILPVVFELDSQGSPIPNPNFAEGHPVDPAPSETPASSDWVPLEMVAYYITDEQRTNLTNESLDVQFSVWGQTLVPALQAYVENLAAHPDDMDAVDTSTIATSPDLDVVTQLKEFVRSSLAEERDSGFFVCPTYLEHSIRRSGDRMCRNFTTTKFPIPQDPRSSLAIARSTDTDHYADREANHFWVKTTDIPVITETGQVVFGPAAATP